MMHRLPGGKPQYKRIEVEFNAWRKSQNLSQADVAERVEATQPMVSRVIRGQIENPQLLNRLCTMAGVNVHKKDPSYSPVLSAALDEIWDGSDDQAQMIAMLLLSANRIATNNAAR
jgi:transcriptional regulator with XRE-family HTH domain